MIFVFKTSGNNQADAEKWEKRLTERLGDMPKDEKFLFVAHNGLHLTFQRNAEDVVSRTVRHTIRWPPMRISFVEGFDGRRMTVPLPFHPARSVVYYDFETTSIVDAHVLQIGAVKVFPDGKEATYNFYVNPAGHPINEGASKVHGLTSDHWLMQNSRLYERRALQFLLALCAPGDLLVAYFGYQFDHKVLADRCEALDVPVPPHLLFADPSRLVRTKFKNTKLVEAARAHNVDMEAVNRTVAAHNWAETLQTLRNPHPEDVAWEASAKEELLNRATNAHDALFDAVVLCRLDQAMKREEGHEYLL